MCHFFMGVYRQYVTFLNFKNVAYFLNVFQNKFN